MAIDGSFSLESALERFLFIYPRLGFWKGDGRRSGEYGSRIVFAPYYTIPLIGCFRPIARKIVDIVVALLRLVPNLRSNSNESGNFDDTDVVDVVGVVQFHVQSSISHIVWTAMIQLLPDCVQFAVVFINRMPRLAHMECFTVEFIDDGLICTIVVVKHYLNAVRTSHRLLIIEPEISSNLWDWSCFLDLAKNFGNLYLSNGAELKKDIADEGEEQDDSDKVPNKDDKGIEIELDFTAGRSTVMIHP
ncbi:hypothetical protein LWI28_003437 [Acer negundo]|uniref:Uncharacterized protein n=1 Tax=Acer negundo TaxID=4023 RepID=A0AAD5JGR1_ACENE|nr:hypothetical protein LWI28_003437 [Acer negundo]